MEVPIKEKVELLLDANAAAMAAGANYVNSILFLVNEQKYFASTDGSYIDQDVHRIWPPLKVTAIDKASGKFRNARRSWGADGHGLRVPRRRRRAARCICLAA